MNRFWGKVRVGDADECWPWTAGVDTSGYGSFNYGGIKRAHRVAYELQNGPIPLGENYHGTVIMHVCDNKLCCNPAHLKAGSHADNMGDMRAKRRRKDICSGRGNGRAKLTLEQVIAIRADPRSNAATALGFGVSKGQIQRIRTGKQWIG